MKTIAVKCPNCKKNVVWEKTNSSKPFCSARCKLIDLGAWANDKHCIIGEKIENTAEEKI